MGKRVSVYGTVTKTGRDLTGNPYVLLDCGPDSQFGVQCLFDHADVEQLAGIFGKQVYINGEFKGKLGNVLFNQCKIIKVSEDQ